MKTFEVTRRKGMANVICPHCGTEAVEQEVLDADSRLVFLMTICHKCPGGRVLLMRQANPQANPRSPLDEAKEE